MSQLALELRGLHKRFGQVRAVDGASLVVRPGEVHALLGQNGCGKSTLVKVLTGFHEPDEAEVAQIWGEDLSFPVRAPLELGIAVIHQDLALIDTMTVVENVGVSTSYATRGLGAVRWGRERRDAIAALDSLGLDIDPGRMVGELTAAERAAVAVARAVRELRAYSGRQLLILDEPTAYLPSTEAEKVMTMMRTVASNGSAVVFISHRLNEVVAVCDRATILRDGRTVAEVDVAESSPRLLIAAMLGRDLDVFYPDKPDREPGPVAFAARALTAGVLRDVSLDLHEGEILGVTGLAGQGQQELPYVLAGVEPSTAGEMTVAGESLPDDDPRARMARGMVLVPANRKRDGVWLDATAAENVSLPALSDHVVNGLLRPRRERERARHMLERLGVRPPDPTLRTSGFSGGNQQKIVLAKWLQSDPRILILDEPTQGVDAGAKREILGLVVDSASAGAAVLICSSDHEEVAHVCTRVLVLREGRVVAEMVGDEVTEQAILEHCNAYTAAVA